MKLQDLIKLQESHDRLYWELHDLIKCIRDFQLGDYSPLMDEIFDSEHALKLGKGLTKTDKYGKGLKHEKRNSKKDIQKKL
jgi:hypothetical protein